MYKTALLSLVLFFPIFTIAQARTNAKSNTGTQLKDTSKSIFADTAGNVLSDVVLVGSRSGLRSIFGSPIPVDVVSAAELKTTGEISLDLQLQLRAPSFNTVNKPVSDATSLFDPYEIRNMGSSRTLVMINGKRKNLSSLLFLQPTIGRGETGTDLTAIPTSAIGKVEILRDGASAQYGSDAVAGVINIVLKKDTISNSLELQSGVTHKLDGFYTGLTYSGASTLLGKGSINYVVELMQRNNAERNGIVDPLSEKATFGGTPSKDAAIDAYLKRFPTANNRATIVGGTIGKWLVNFSYPISSTTELYGFAAQALRRSVSNANFRPPYWRIDYGVLHTAVPGQPNYTGTSDVLYDGYLGYLPTFEADLNDYNATIGLKQHKKGWVHDLSWTIGGNKQVYTIENTVNASLGAASPSRFKPGGFSFSHVVGNYDASTSLSDKVKIGFGSEFRNETYSVIAGDTASSFGEGSNSYPGISQKSQSTNTRYNIGAYGDLTWEPSAALLMNATARMENYSDFGNAFIWKLSGRYLSNDNKLVLRAGVSTSFKAPALHQIYTELINSNYFQGDVKLFGLYSNRSKEVRQLGVPLLKPEKSFHFTTGFSYKPIQNFSFTLDYYDIIIRDRILYSASITSNDPTTELYQILQASGIASAQFFVNGINTHTSGFDFVAQYSLLRVGRGKMNLNVAANLVTDNRIIGKVLDPKPIANSGATISDALLKSIIENSRPRYKVVMGASYRINKMSYHLNNTVFGSTAYQDINNGGLIMQHIQQKFSPAMTTDFHVARQLRKNMQWSFTVNNIFNVLPKWKLEALDETGANYLANPLQKQLLEGGLTFNGRYSISGYYGSQFSQLGTTFATSLKIDL
jgi:iron complex outermembrane receptor protein